MFINGKQVVLSDINVKSLKELIKFYKLNPGSVAIEINGEIPSRSEWDSITIKESDRIELIRFVGGGQIKININFEMSDIFNYVL